jgi:hypothetical protein
MQITEQERAAYIAGYTARADLFGRIDDLTEALGVQIAQEVDTIDNLTAERDMLLERVDELLGEIAELRAWR